MAIAGPPTQAVVVAILWLAVDEARGHLMRAHIARRVLAHSRIAVDIATTSEQGRAFLAEFGSPCRVLPSAYRLAYDASHNLQDGLSMRRFGRYAASPRGLARDLEQLRRWSRPYDLVVDDSFHPALVLGVVASTLRDRLVHVYSQHLPWSVEAACRQRYRRSGRALAGAFRRACAGAFAHVEHTLDLDARAWADARRFRLPPLLPAPERGRDRVRADLGVPVDRKLAVLYLNPHFREAELAGSIVDGLTRRGCFVHAVGEGLPADPRWRARDPRLTDVIAASDVFVAGAGMGAVGHVAAFGVPFVALASRQPEQLRNIAELSRFGGSREVVDVNDRERLTANLDAALDTTLAQPHAAGIPMFSPIQTQRAWAEAFERLVDARHADS